MRFDTLFTAIRWLVVTLRGFKDDHPPPSHDLPCWRRARRPALSRTRGATPSFASRAAAASFFRISTSDHQHKTWPACSYQCIKFRGQGHNALQVIAQKPFFAISHFTVKLESRDWLSNESWPQTAHKWMWQLGLYLSPFSSYSPLKAFRFASKPRNLLFDWLIIAPAPSIAMPE